MKIVIDDLSQQDIIDVLLEHHKQMFNHSPAESVHALDLDGLRAPNMTFWSAWIDDEIAGCGGMKELSPDEGEIKAMRTVDKFLRKGVAVSILEAIIGEAKRRGYNNLNLETGTHDAFLPARKMYANRGFEICGPFGDYQLDPYSTFMTLHL